MDESAYLESNSDVKVNEYELDGEIVRSAGNGGMFSSSGGQSCIVDAFFFESACAFGLKKRAEITQPSD